MDKIEKEAYEIYKKKGQQGVYDYADSLQFRLPYAYCCPCEEMSPIYNDACLVCGSSYNGRVCGFCSIKH